MRTMMSRSAQNMLASASRAARSVRAMTVTPCIVCEVLKAVSTRLSRSTRRMSMVPPGTEGRWPIAR